MKLIHFLNAATVSVILSACGGGGGGGPAPQPDPGNAVGSLAIEGTVVKGPVSNATIRVHGIAADGSPGSVLAQTTSGSDGKYRVAVDGYSGVVLLVASMSELSTMYDEATGEILKPPAEFTMRASLSTEIGKTYSAHINPFTEMATAAALASSGRLSPSNVERANRDMATILPFNPLTALAEFDPVANEPRNGPALALAAISRMAFVGSLGCGGGVPAARVACVVAEMAKKSMTDADVKLALEAHSDDLADLLGMTRLMFGVPSESIMMNATPREQTTAFMSMLLGNAMALGTADLSLRTELETTALGITSRSAAVTASNLDALNLAIKGVQFWNDLVKRQTTPFVQFKHFYKGHQYLGKCGFYRDSGYSIASTSAGDVAFVDCGTAPEFIPDLNANGEYNSCSSVGELCSTAWSVRIRLHPDPLVADKLTVYTQTRQSQYKFTTRSYRYSDGGKTVSGPTCPAGASCIPIVVQYEDTASRIHFGASFPGNISSLVTQRDGDGKVTVADLSGEFSPAFHIAHNTELKNLQLRWARKLTNALVLGDRQNVTLNLTASTVDMLDKLAVVGSMDVLNSGTTETRIKLGAGSYILVKPEGANTAADGTEEMFLKIETTHAGILANGNLKIGAFQFDASRSVYLPTLISFSGAVQRNGVRFFDGTLTGEILNQSLFDVQMPPSSSNFRTKRVTVKGDVNVPGRSVLTVNLSAAQKDTGSTANDTIQPAGKYMQSGQATVNASGSSGPFSDLLALESTDGIRIIIDRSKDVYPLWKNIDPMGTYSVIEKKMTFEDGSVKQY